MDEHLRTAFMELIQSNEGIIYKVIMLYSNLEEERHDLKQEILYQAWKSFPNFKRESKFSTWLYRIALNTVLSFKRKAKNKQAIDDVYLSQQNPAEEHEDYEVLYHLIKQLNEIDRMIMTLHMEGYKNPEIAEITGMNTNQLNVKLHRVKAKIIKQFKHLNNV